MGNGSSVPSDDLPPVVPPMRGTRRPLATNSTMRQRDADLHNSTPPPTGPAPLDARPESRNRRTQSLASVPPVSSQPAAPYNRAPNGYAYQRRMSQQPPDEPLPGPDVARRSSTAHGRPPQLQPQLLPQDPAPSGPMPGVAGRRHSVHSPLPTPAPASNLHLQANPQARGRNQHLSPLPQSGSPPQPQPTPQPRSRQQLLSPLQQGSAASPHRPGSQPHPNPQPLIPQQPQPEPLQQANPQASVLSSRPQSRHDTTEHAAPVRVGPLPQLRPAPPQRQQSTSRMGSTTSPPQPGSSAASPLLPPASATSPVPTTEQALTSAAPLPVPLAAAVPTTSAHVEVVDGSSAPLPFHLATKAALSPPEPRPLSQAHPLGGLVEDDSVRSLNTTGLTPGQPALRCASVSASFSTQGFNLGAFLLSKDSDLVEATPSSAIIPSGVQNDADILSSVHPNAAVALPKVPPKQPIRALPPRATPQAAAATSAPTDVHPTHAEAPQHAPPLQPQQQQQQPAQAEASQRPHQKAKRPRPVLRATDEQIPSLSAVSQGTHSSVSRSRRTSSSAPLVPLTAHEVGEQVPGLSEFDATGAPDYLTTSKRRRRSAEPSTLEEAPAVASRRPTAELGPAGAPSGVVRSAPPTAGASKTRAPPAPLSATAFVAGRDTRQPSSQFTSPVVGMSASARREDPAAAAATSKDRPHAKDPKPKKNRQAPLSPPSSGSASTSFVFAEADLVQALDWTAQDDEKPFSDPLPARSRHTPMFPAQPPSIRSSGSDYSLGADDFHADGYWDLSQEGDGDRERHSPLVSEGSSDSDSESDSSSSESDEEQPSHAELKSDVESDTDEGMLTHVPTSARRLRRRISFADEKNMPLENRL